MSFTPRLPDYLRFEVFKRDGFQCQYCGFCPDSRGFFRSLLVLVGSIVGFANCKILGTPENNLEVDHIEPRCEGGEDALDNLITACKRCNGGKWGVRLDKKILSLRSRRQIAERVREDLEALHDSEYAIEALQKQIWNIKQRHKNAGSQRRF